MFYSVIIINPPAAAACCGHSPQAQSCPPTLWLTHSPSPPWAPATLAFSQLTNQRLDICSLYLEGFLPLLAHSYSTFTSPPPFLPSIPDSENPSPTPQLLKDLLFGHVDLGPQFSYNHDLVSVGCVISGGPGCTVPGLSSLFIPPSTASDT